MHFKDKHVKQIVDQLMEDFDETMEHSRDWDPAWDEATKQVKVDGEWKDLPLMECLEELEKVVMKEFVKRIILERL